jgi:hypothetical protein
MSIHQCTNIFIDKKPISLNKLITRRFYYAHFSLYFHPFKKKPVHLVLDCYIQLPANNGYVKYFSTSMKKKEKILEVLIIMYGY